MKLLLLADLHARWDWFAWAATQEVDALLIAGDVLDAFDEQGLLPQQIKLLRWTQSCRLPLAFCSGNHDANSREDASAFQKGDGLKLSPADQEILGRLGESERWMDVAGRAGVVTDGHSEVLSTSSGHLVVSTIPYDFSGEESFSELWRQGAELRRKHCLPWLVLHHDPPADTAVGGVMGDPNLYERIERYAPDFVISGHLHEQPYNQSFIDRVERTWCFNPGAPEPPSKNREPNRIELDLAKNTATWIASRKGQKTPLRISRSLNAAV